MPTPVEHLGRLSQPGCDLWVKREDLTHPMYGGNKVRKLERILAEAERRGARRLVTAGAVGSHHVLATALFGRQAGFEVDAVLVPQPRTDYVVTNLRADLALGARLFPVGSYAAAPLAIIRRLGRDALYVPIGGTNMAGTLGYVDAARELATQIRAGEMPEPDVAVVTLGSGGTAAGLAAGFALEGLRIEVVGVAVVSPVWAVSLTAHALAWRCARGAASPVRLRTVRRYLGPGYGHRTPEGDHATMAAAASGLTPDPTYTAKAFAAALDFVGARRYRNVLYVHTVSSAPMAPLVASAPEERDFPPELARLLR